MTMQQSLFERVRQAARPDDPFEIHWKLWPRKDDKQSSRRAYQKALKKIYPADLDKAIRSYTAKCAGKEAQFIPMFSTWLNKERWVDEETQDDKQKKSINRDEIIVSMIKRKIKSNNISDNDVRMYYNRGLLTAEECKNYGVRV